MLLINIQRNVSSIRISMNIAEPILSAKLVCIQSVERSSRHFIRQQPSFTILAILTAFHFNKSSCSGIDKYNFVGCVRVEIFIGAVSKFYSVDVCCIRIAFRQYFILIYIITFVTPSIYSSFTNPRYTCICNSHLIHIKQFRI